MRGGRSGTASMRCSDKSLPTEVGLCLWGGRAEGGMKFGAQSWGPYECRAGPLVVTLPRSESRGAGSRSPKQEAWGGGRKAGMAEWGTAGPWACQNCSGCGERIRKPWLLWGWGWGEAAQSFLDPDTSPSTLSQASFPLSAPCSAGTSMP